MVQVTVKEGEPLEKLIRRFQRECEKAGIRKELKKRRFYMKPSEKKNIAKRKMERKARRKKA